MLEILSEEDLGGQWVITFMIYTPKEIFPPEGVEIDRSLLCEQGICDNHSGVVVLNEGYTLADVRQAILDQGHALLPN